MSLGTVFSSLIIFGLCAVDSALILLHCKLLSGIAHLLTVDTSSNDQEVILSIELPLEQLQCKQTILEELDAKIAPLIDRAGRRNCEGGGY